jgi:hypothetical protein
MTQNSCSNAELNAPRLMLPLSPSSLVPTMGTSMACSSTSWKNMSQWGVGFAGRVEGYAREDGGSKDVKRAILSAAQPPSPSLDALCSP